MEELKYIIVLESGDCYFSDELTDKIKEDWNDGEIITIIRSTDMMYYQGEDEWKKSEEWSEE